MLTLKNRIQCIASRVPGGRFDTIGLFDHGGPGEFCLLKSLAGGSIAMDDFSDERCDGGRF